MATKHKHVLRLYFILHMITMYSINIDSKVYLKVYNRLIHLNDIAKS